jgi:hypothetical protein
MEKRPRSCISLKLIDLSLFIATAIRTRLRDVGKGHPAAGT